jgi:uncharacterized protein YcnI
MPELAGLRIEGRAQQRVRVPQSVHGDAGAKVEITFPLRVEEPEPVPGHESEVWT